MVIGRKLVHYLGCFDWLIWRFCEWTFSLWTICVDEFFFPQFIHLYTWEKMSRKITVFTRVLESILNVNMCYVIPSEMLSENLASILLKHGLERCFDKKWAVKILCFVLNLKKKSFPEFHSWMMDPAQGSQFRSDSRSRLDHWLGHCHLHHQTPMHMMLVNNCYLLWTSW